MPRLDSLYTQISAVGALSATPKIQANLHDTTLLFSQLRQGQVFSAEVISKTEHSTYSIRIGQQMIELPLQEELNSGDTLQIRLTSHTPEVQITVLPSKSSHAEPHLFQLEHLNGKIFFRELNLPSGSPPPTATNSSIADLSPAAYLLDQLTNEVRASKESAVTHLTDIQFNPGERESIRRHLELALRHSGLFFFSHVKKYVEGQFPETNLSLDMSAIRREESPLPETLLKQQITVLENNVVHLKFAAPETVEIQWKIQRDNHAGQNATPAERIETWQSEMQLSFPALGTVLVKLMLFGNNLSMQCTLPKGPSDALQKELPTLQSRLRNVGLNAQIHVDELP
ncbi:flagellar hook-length control protein FliK [Undibacterium squillarum]|uniref:Flagellar hook-length control protein-like C-terminal domain-containing protein n=1 Tax=Undibacterium squillarum TaxID=1131567 RepID=A0ABQ2Y0N6_9BURK|nr:flagellar hook-length control protein FliK [Undibacterium squillarum]GGX49249.1 hypothetical protein GCM10010946_29890 [Undibacterium squillarum]